MLDQQRIRTDFPLFNRTIQGKPIIYLDSAATSLKPIPVLDAMWGYYTKYSANIHRGIYTISEEATVAYNDSRTKIATFIGANTPKEVIFVRNATEALNLIARTIGNTQVNSESTVVTTIIEHHANFVTWQQLAFEKNAKFIVVKTERDGIIEQQLLNKYITRSTKIFAFSAMSNVLGTIQDVAGIVKAVKKISPECIVVVDAAQAIPHSVVNVVEWGADFVVFSGHKLLGPTGIGVLWGTYEILASMPPYQFGGDMIREVTIEKTLFQDPPERFEAGTPDIAQAIGLGAAVEYLETLGMNDVRAHEIEIVTYALEKLLKIPGLYIVGPLDPLKRGGVVSFTIDGVHPHDISQILNEDNICIRAGHHCAMPLHTHLNISATARASFYIYTTQSDVDILVEGLNKVIKIFT